MPGGSKPKKKEKINWEPDEGRLATTKPLKTLQQLIIYALQRCIHLIRIRQYRLGRWSARTDGTAQRALVPDELHVKTSSPASSSAASLSSYSSPRQRQRISTNPCQTASSHRGGHRRRRYRIPNILLPSALQVPILGPPSSARLTRRMRMRVINRRKAYDSLTALYGASLATALKLSILSLTTDVYLPREPAFPVPALGAVCSAQPTQAARLREGAPTKQSYASPQ
ncbi:hypothetical protein R3P38DRAFT_2959084 [Favolaschia claudopus]|uniref:Uncharacterized protein n=1 Tax=Favolaschia claudopus TaxID=2862362 RepID=A0AAW0BB92_9AGAR